MLILGLLYLLLGNKACVWLRFGIVYQFWSNYQEEHCKASHTA